MQKTINLSYGSVIVGIAVLLIKYYAYAITGSIALLSDAIESVVNVIASFVTVVALHLSSKPADSKHHYGHYKLEYFSAFFEGCIIIVASLMIFKELGASLNKNDYTIDSPVAGLILSGAATMLNGIWGLIIIRHGKKHNSPAMVADGKHLISDVVTSFGVAIGLFLVIVTNYTKFDAFIALCLGLYLFKTGGSLIYDSFSGLMDAAPSAKEMETIRDAIRLKENDIIETHDLRVRRSGRVLFIDFHMVVSSDMTVRESHDICDIIEDNIQSFFPESIITIHVEPEYKRHF